MKSAILFVLGFLLIIGGIVLMSVRVGTYNPWTWSNFWNPPHTSDEYNQRLVYSYPYRAQGIMLLVAAVAAIILGKMLGTHKVPVEKRYCRHCGTQISQEALHCSNCGEKQ